MIDYASILTFDIGFVIETGGGRQPPMRPIVDTLRAQVQTGRRGRETPRQRSTVGVTKDFNGARSVARPGIVRGTRRQNEVSGRHAAPRERIRARGRFSQLVGSFEKFDISDRSIRINGAGIDGRYDRRCGIRLADAAFHRLVRLARRMANHGSAWRCGDCADGAYFHTPAA